MKRLFSSLPLCVLLPGIALAGPPPADEYFPLEPGTRWTYLNQRFQTEIDAAVVSRDGEIVTYRIASIDYVLHDNGDEIDVQLEGGEFAPFYRFEEDSWVHRDPFGCEDQRTIHVISRNAELETPAGVLLDVLILEYGPAVCGDAGRITEWWAPGVGLVQWDEYNIAGIIRWTLSDFMPPGSEPRFRRGDVTDDGKATITDAIAILSWLFLGEAAPVCQDSADTDDDGKVILSDAVLLLGWLFLGGTEPAPPGPLECGVDPVSDELPSCNASACL